MITENDLIISNKSYINKDFASIYNELVTMAKNLSSKYDPETSNESDPFIVLLKLLAFVGDKLNYNVDKNVLERFMPSATQDTSMRELCEMMGYNPNYYIAPTTDVYIKYIGDEEFTTSHNSFTLPELSTVITTDDGDISYVLTSSRVIDGKNKVNATGIKAIQGTLKTLSILDSEIVQLENLDENNRVYFPEVMVAQNGVFITGGTRTSEDDDWTSVDNLNTQEPGKYVFKFGFDSSKELPYLEFPSDIANLIGSGITIQYIVTNGEQGNVKAKTLTTVQTPTSVNWDNSEDTISFEVAEGENPVLVVNNPSASINGSSPETVNEAYNGFKKIVGTFDTLVSCRDYANFIYGLYDSSGIYPMASNAQVSDRRTDINFANNIVTYTAYGEEVVNKIKQVQKTEGSSSWYVDGISAYDLCVYPLKTIKSYGISEYNASFKRMGSESWSDIVAELADAKCISHDYKDITDSSASYGSLKNICLYKNYLCLEARISTVSKVSTTEASDIISNINQALIKAYNARNVDFGYEIPYDSLLETIESADERIKSVSLAEPSLTTKVLLATSDTDNNTDNNSEIKLLSGSGKEYFITLLAKNILSGKVSLFTYDERFGYDFGQYPYVNGTTTIPMINSVDSVTTSANLVVTTSGITLKENEVIQMVAPSLVTDVTYTYGVNYSLTLTSASGTYIPKNTEYELKSNEYCIFEYTDTNDNQVVKVYQHTTDTPTIIKPNVDLYTTSYRKSSREGYTSGETPIHKKIEDTTSIPSSLLDNGYMDVFTLSTNDQVEHRTINQESLDHNVYCYWVINNSTNTINWDSNGKYMLENGEYFFQTDEGFNNLYSYGSGTVITKTGFSGADWSADKLSISVLSDGGLLSHKEYFKRREITTTDTLSFLEQQILTLVEEDSIKLNTGATSIQTTNSFVDVPSGTTVYYKLSGEDTYTPLQSMDFTGGYWKIRERLDINFGPGTVQTLIDNQTMTFTFSNSSSIELGSGCNIQAVYLHQTSGGTGVDMKVLSLEDLTSYVSETIYCYAYNTGTGYAPTSKSNGYYTVDMANPATSSASSSVTYRIPNISTTTETLIMIYNDTTSVGTLTVTTDTGGSAYKYYLKDDSSATGRNELDVGINVIAVTNTSTITITATGTYAGRLTFSGPRIATGINEKLGLKSVVDSTDSTMYETIDSAELALRAKIKEFDTDHIFYYSNEVNSSDLIESDDLSSPSALYDYNNVGNKWTLSEIDFGASSIQVVKNSLQ